MSANPATQTRPFIGADENPDQGKLLIRSIAFPLVLRPSHRLSHCPEFVIELRSPSDSLSDLEQKMSDWLANGAQLAWLIDPQRKLAIIYRPGHEPETLLQPEILHAEDPVAGFVLKMRRLWE